MRAKVERVVETTLAALVASALVAGCSRKAPPRAAKHVKEIAKAKVAAAPRPPPPPPPPAPAGDGTFTVAGLHYVEWVTGGASPSNGLPMVVALHGHGGTPEMFQRHFANFPLKVRFIAPFGLHPAERSGFEWFPRVAHMSAQQLAQVMPPVINRVAAAIAEIEKVRPTVGKPVLTGFSQGAVMTYGLAVLKPEMFSFACPMAGELPPQLVHGLPPVRPEIHGFHGDQDRTVDFSNGRLTVDTLKKVGFTADLTVIRGVAHKFDPAAGKVAACVDKGVRKASLPVLPK
jgi:phospholipase/carboxylesterase